jgi:uncharacterized membrane protein
VEVRATPAPVDEEDVEGLLKVIWAISGTQPWRVPQPVLVTQVLVEVLAVVVVVVPLFEMLTWTHSGCSVGTGAGGCDGM